MADFIAGTGITRVSLYDAFGGKEQRFVRALQKYDKDNRRATLAGLEAMDDPKRAIAALFGGSMEVMSNYTTHLANTPVDRAFRKFEWPRRPDSSTR